MLSKKLSLLTTSVLVALGYSATTIAAPTDTAAVAEGATNITISSGNTTNSNVAASAPATTTTNTDVGDTTANYTVKVTRTVTPNSPAASANAAPAPQGTVTATAPAPVATAAPKATAAAATPATPAPATPAPAAAATSTANATNATTTAASSTPKSTAKQSAAASQAAESQQPIQTEILTTPPKARNATANNAANDKPSFTFEQQGNSLNGGAAPGNVSMGSTTSLQPIPGEQLQEVSVPVLGDFDNALCEAFRSLSSGITLGLGPQVQIASNQIAPAVRNITTDDSGNLVVSFSVPAAEELLKQQGALSWQGLSNPILMWMVNLDSTNAQGNKEAALVSGQNLSNFAQNILQAAPDYKYRLMFPILDLEEIQKVTPQTVLNSKVQDLASASARYGADYFLASTIGKKPNSDEVSLKWNLYNRQGQAIANSSLSGSMDEVASLGAGDVARALVSHKSNLKQAPKASRIKANNINIEVLGPGEGFVRMRVGNIRTLKDIDGLRRTFVSYGFDGNTRVVGYNNNQFIVEIGTNSDPNTIEGSLRNSGDFTYLGPWTFNYLKSSLSRPALNTTIGKPSKDRPNSQITISQN